MPKFRAPKYHHYWNIMSTMPPLKHKRGSKSPLLEWIMQRAKCDEVTALNAFESAKQARYLIHKDAAWHYDANAGFDHWNKKPTGADPAPATDPEDDGLEPLRQKAAAYAAAKAGALDNCRQWPRMSKLDAMERAAQEWPELDTAQHAQLFKQLASAGTIITGPDWIRGNPA